MFSRRSLLSFTFMGVLSVACPVFSGDFVADSPNVILVITDDQGYGDVAAHGNTMINTPHLDVLHGQRGAFPICGRGCYQASTTDWC